MKESYKHDIGKGLFVNAHSLSPDIDAHILQGIVCSLDGKARHDFSDLQKTIVQTDYLESMEGLRLVVHEGAYQVPASLRQYREAVGKKWESEGKFNGPVLIATKDIKFPLNVIQGGYFDYAATRLNEEPAKLLPNEYPAGKTVEAILAETGFKNEDRARYFGMAHLIWPSNGDEFILVQRAKGMGIAADCLSSPGSTPDIDLSKPGIKKPGFGIRDYWSHHFAEEMNEEFHLKWGDFWLGGIPVFDDAKSCPFGAANIFTDISARQISERAYGDPRVLKEHSIIYSMPTEAMRVFLQRFPVFPSVARVMDTVAK